MDCWTQYSTPLSDPLREQVEVNSKMHLFCSLLCVETADRPGLIVDLVKIITDINVDVESGEFDTEVRILQEFFQIIS